MNTRLKHIKTASFITVLKSTRMNRSLLLLGLIFSLLLFLSEEASAQCAGCTTIISGVDDNDYTVNVGEKICLGPTAEYTGRIELFGGDFENCAILPQDFNFDFSSANPNGTIINNGTMIMPSFWTIAQNFIFNNYGTLEVSASFSVSSNVVLNNYGILEVGHLHLKLSSSVNNYGAINGTGNININANGTFNNYSTGVGNVDRIIISNTMLNEGEINVVEELEIEAGGTLTNNGGCISTKDLRVNGDLIGFTCGTITVAEASRVSNFNATVTGDIAIVDETPPASAPFVDLNVGTIAPSVTWVSCGCPSEVIVEDCTDGIDNDLDCLVDCDDPDCGVSVLEPKINEPMKFVYGQEDFYSNMESTSDSTLFRPRDIHQDPTSNKIFIADKLNHRVLRYAGVDEFINNSPAEAVFGQVDFDTKSAGLSSTKMNNPHALFVDENGTLWVTDNGNVRVLRFDNASTKPSGSAADGVLGQANFNSSTPSTSINTMTFLSKIYVDDLGALWVSDDTRILRFDDAASKANGANADAVFGQSDFNSSIVGTSNTLFRNPRGIVKICNKLYVADIGNDRIVWFESPNTSGNGPIMNGVIGQADFTNGTSSLTQNGFNSPIDLTVDNENTLYVVDFGNNRVVTIKDFTSKSFVTDFDAVWNQPDFTSDDEGLGTNQSEDLNGIAILKEGNRTYVASVDRTNNRIEIRGNDIFASEHAIISGYLRGEDLANTGTLNFNIVSQPTLGTVTIDNSSTGAYTYIAPQSTSLTSTSILTFEYSVTNGHSCSRNGTMTIHLSPFVQSIEVCNDGLDNDLDSFIDCDDSDCNDDPVCLDSDNDSVNDAFDVDDDNDGILDFSEFSCFPGADKIIDWTSNDASLYTGENLRDEIILSADDLVFGSGLGGHFGADFILISDMNATNLSGAIGDEDYIQYGFTTKSDINAMYLRNFLHVKQRIVLPERHSDSYGYDIAILISDDDFSSYRILNLGHTIDAVMPVNFTSEQIPILNDNFYYLEPSTHYSIRLVFYNRTTDLNLTAVFDDFAIEVTECAIGLDIDSDSSPGHIDADTDGDGCFDVIEAGFPDADGDGKLGGLVPPNVDGDGKVTSGGL